MRRSFHFVATCTVIIAGLALHGCASQQIVENTAAAHALSPDSNATQNTKASELPLLQSWFSEALHAVSDELNVDMSHVTMQVTDAQGIASHAKSTLMDSLRTDLTNTTFAESLVKNILSIQTQSVLALYSPTHKQILLHEKNVANFLLARNTNPKNAMQALLIHELVHAADDAKHDAFNQTSMHYQEVFAKSAVMEGHAQWQTRRICQKIGCSTAFDDLNAYMFDTHATDDPALEYVQSRSFKNLEFIYKEGERFIETLYKRDKNLIAKAFAQPPRDSIQIIAPESFPNLDREQKNDKLSNIIEAAAKPWKTQSTGRLKRNVLAAFNVDPAARQPVVSFYTNKIIAASKHEYYDQKSDLPIPIAVIALQTDHLNTANKTATMLFESTVDNYNQLDGELIDINNWTREHHTATVKVGNGESAISMNTASGYMVNGLVQAAYPVTVITASSGPYLVHIHGRQMSDTQEALMQFAGNLLIAMQAQQ